MSALPVAESTATLPLQETRTVKLDAIVGEYVRQKPELLIEILSPDHRFGAVSTNNAKKNLFRFIQALTRANITIPI